MLFDAHIIAQEGALYIMNIGFQWHSQGYCNSLLILTTKVNLIIECRKAFIVFVKLTLTFEIVTYTCKITNYMLWLL